MEALETIGYKGYKIEVHQDECDHSPREDDNLGHMVCWHRRYELGDKHDFGSPDDFKKYIKNKTHLILPLYLYDHSGLTMNTTGFHCRWDSGQVGWIYISKADARKEYGWVKLSKKRVTQIENYLKGEVKTYDQYLTGEVYGYKIMLDDEEIESCWGYYGETDYMVSECKAIIDNIVKPDYIKTIRGL